MTRTVAINWRLVMSTLTSILSAKRTELVAPVVARRARA